MSPGNPDFDPGTLPQRDEDEIARIKALIADTGATAGPYAGDGIVDTNAGETAAGEGEAPQNTSNQATLEVRGQPGAGLTPGDPLKFPGRVQTLGAGSLPDRWGYRIEETGTVPDDISTWTVSRTMTDKIIFTNRDGSTSSTGLTRGHAEYPNNISQPEGGKRFFSIDAPGIDKRFVDERSRELYKKLTYVGTFTTHLDKGQQHIRSTWRVTVSLDMNTLRVTGQFRKLR